MANLWIWLGPAIISASVAITVAVLTPQLAALQRRRDAINSKFDEAVAALARVQGARHIPSAVARQYHPGNAEEYRAYQIRMSEKSIDRFIEETTKAREALSELILYVPEAHTWITGGWEIAQEDEPQKRETLEEWRRPSLKSERLFRSRHYPVQGQADPDST